LFDFELSSKDSFFFILSSLQFKNKIEIKIIMVNLNFIFFLRVIFLIIDGNVSAAWRSGGLKCTNVQASTKVNKNT
jgi:hypothetical protein